ncbi:MAG: hypothetical protein H6718_06100 [Polyangiaceae bacterium]|nr:hypothetical protein [Myxococcales bacterium]MCB9584949.1 hypothetical protein [Polyangiaceae bacterium]MCB9607478.1 hypothetical protein [Polyangiaceae bacterium]
MSLLNPAIEAELERLLVTSGLDDHAWLSALEEYDQPPLFIRYSPSRRSLTSRTRFVVSRFGLLERSSRASSRSVIATPLREMFGALAQGGPACSAEHLTRAPERWFLEEAPEVLKLEGNGPGYDEWLRGQLERWR